MRSLLKVSGAILAAIALVAAIAVALNWTFIHNLRTLKETTVLDVDKFQPRRVLAGCPTRPLERYRADNPLPQSAFDKMWDYSSSQGGIGLMVLVDGKIAGEAYRADVNKNTRTLSYSMHKSVMALAYGAALQDGIIGSIDDAIGTYIKEWKNDPRGEIPVRAFLTMSSGLAPPDFTDLSFLELNYSDRVTHTALSFPIAQPPFQVFRYKGLDSQIAGTALARALERAGKGPYSAYLSEKIWCPIGAKDALLWPEDKNGYPRFFAYLDASLSDWARIGQLIMEGGTFGGQQILPKSWLEEQLSPSATNANYGLQTWLGAPYSRARAFPRDGARIVEHSEPYLADDVVFLDGFGGQRVYAAASAKLVIVRTSDVGFTYDDYVLVNIALKALASPL